ncbi:helix-turn-helix domain-containing protein [Komagataeibacter oboediens]|uniref:helix-turn-helix domain-containing protein n=1 Tax=Komagataeibacter oboediens TaxID=65958 RepID=UPI001C2DE57D|nr:helix-turn-helix transcriptional regulator [Komagataeibacter oboediens]MBV1825308.1 helix-turn-helix domain-containing protein [Komagataeibacter oboediens]
MITGRQVRAARALLNWTQEELATHALVALTALKRLESERGLTVHESTADQVRRALETAGILFITSDRGHGVMFLNGTSDPVAGQTDRHRPRNRS